VAAPQPMPRPRQRARCRMVMHKTQRRVMLKFLKQHAGVWLNAKGHRECDICYCLRSKKCGVHVTLANYIVKPEWDDKGPYSDVPPQLCTEHAQELGLVW